MDAFYAAVESARIRISKGSPCRRPRPAKAFPGGRPHGKLRGPAVRHPFGDAAIQASRCVPRPVFVPPHFELYGRVSSEIMELLRGFGGPLNRPGIEEGYLDVTVRCGADYGRARTLAAEIKPPPEEQRLTCSIGIGRRRPSPDRLRLRETGWSHGRVARPGPRIPCPQSRRRPRS